MMCFNEGKKIIWEFEPLTCLRCSGLLRLLAWFLFAFLIAACAFAETAIRDDEWKRAKQSCQSKKKTAGFSRCINQTSLSGDEACDADSACR